MSTDKHISTTPRFALTRAAAAMCHDGSGGMALAAKSIGLAGDMLVAGPGGQMALRALQPGDSVATSGGPARVARIERRGVALLAGQRGLAPPWVRIRAEAIAPGVPEYDVLLARDQRVTTDGVTAAAARLVNGTSIRAEPAGADPVCVVLHLEQAHDVLVGGLACVTGDTPRDSPDDAVLRLWRRLSAPPDEPDPPRGELLGDIARFDHDGVAGWTLDPAHPDVPVPLEVLADGRVIARLVAALRRPDLEMRGLGGGQCGFALRFPVPLERRRDHVVEIRRAGDGAPVPGSPRLLPAAATATPEAERLLAAAIAGAGDTTERTGLATDLAAALETLLQLRVNSPD